MTSLARLFTTTLFIAIVFGLAAQDLVPEVPSVVLLDQLSGRILYQKQPDLPIPPASLTKLMTLHLAWKALADGRVTPSQPVPITGETTGRLVPPGSSLMFLEPGQQVTFRELMLGLAVDSGNDAGMTLARFLAGSQQAFVAAMNAEASTLGLRQTVFFDAFGYDPRNRTTAADFAQFCRFYLAAHPQSVQVLHSVREMAFPLEANRPVGDRRPVRTIVQTNRNNLLGLYPGADGLKTGFIEESGYNLAATAQRGDQRLVAVLLGVQGRDAVEGSRIRTAAAVRLLDFGFTSYPLRPLPLPAIPTIRVWFSAPGSLVPAPGGPTVYPLANDELAVQVRWVGPLEVAGPVEAGAVLGHLVWSKDGKDFHSVAMKAAKAAPAAPWWVGAWDRIVLFFRGLTGAKEPTSISGPRK